MPPSGWGTSENSFNSINVNHNWVLGGSKLNEFIFQYADFANAIGANSLDPYMIFPNTVAIGQNTNTPQQTQQKKYQFRDDFSWNVAGMGGLGHDFKAGVNFIRSHVSSSRSTRARATTPTRSARTTSTGSSPTSPCNGGSPQTPTSRTRSSAWYIQDDWRLNDRLTLNMGFRYDIIDGWAIDQTRNPNFVILQNAGRAGRFAGQQAFRDFGLDPKEDTNNYQGRIGLAWNVDGNGRDVVRLG